MEMISNICLMVRIQIYYIIVFLETPTILTTMCYLMVKIYKTRKKFEVKKAHIEALDNYIGAKVVVQGKYYIPVLS